MLDKKIVGVLEFPGWTVIGYWQFRRASDNHVRVYDG